MNVTIAMRAVSRLLQDRILLKGLLALALSYVLMVQSLSGHHDRFIADASGLHTFCVNEPDATDNDTPSNSSHHSQVPCCLIFSTGDLPRVLPIITAFRFTKTLSEEPHQEFLHAHKERFATEHARPRAPPLMG